MTFETILPIWVISIALNAVIVGYAWIRAVKLGKLTRGHIEARRTDRTLALLTGLVYLGPILPLLVLVCVFLPPKRRG